MAIDRCRQLRDPRQRRLLQRRGVARDVCFPQPPDLWNAPIERIDQFLKLRDEQQALIVGSLRRPGHDRAEYDTPTALICPNLNSIAPRRPPLLIDLAGADADHVSALSRTAAIFFTALLAISATAAAQPADAVVRGQVLDDSGGVLPGVTVIATGANGQIIGRTFTDERGRFEIAALPSGAVSIAFELQGFDGSIVKVKTYPGAELQIVERLKVARMTEEVIVYGTIPVEPKPYPGPLTPARPNIIPIPVRELESVCKPAKPSATETFGTITAHRYAHGRMLYSKGDELIIDAGSLNGLEVGRNLVVRRSYRGNSPEAQFPEMAEHTAGLVQIVAVTERTATAVVVHACNEVMKGDVLAAFTPEYVRTPEPVGTPMFEEAARILFADERQMLGTPRRLLIIDRGSEQGVQPGQRFTLFRRKDAAARPFVTGEAIVVSVRADSATIRVTTATDAIWFGDFAAPQRVPPALQQ